MMNSFKKFYVTERSWMAPHPFIICGLGCQVFAIFLQMLHLWVYSYDGWGLTFLDIISKVSQGLSETIISLLLILLASGWKLHYQEIDYDDNLELHLPMMGLVLILHIVIVAVAFVDLDASHKYHDFSGYTGWSMLVIKTLLFCYFLYCYYDAKENSKARRD